MSNKQSMPPYLEEKVITIGARSSPLSRVQVNEAEAEIRGHFPYITFSPLFVETVGDKDKKTSLRTLGQTDFFTKEIDDLLLSGRCRLGVHSAKDLPSPIPKGLKIAAVTRGVDPSDSLVFRKGENLATLPMGAKIATSSERREEIVRSLREDLQFIDLRGTIGERLKKLENGEADGVVIAEAALIRLNLTHLERIQLPGVTAEGQGQLAILVREDDQEMEQLFETIDARKKVLAVGLTLPPDDLTAKFLHFPLIAIFPRDPQLPEIKSAFSHLIKATHLIFTSKPSVSLFFQAFKALKMPTETLEDKTWITVGSKTAETLSAYGISSALIPRVETAEGIVQLLDEKKYHRPRFFWPHSALSKDVIREYFLLKDYHFDEVVLYDTRPEISGAVPNENSYQEILFTSPSTVDAYLKFFGTFPKSKTLNAIGPVTAKHLAEKTKQR